MCRAHSAPPASPRSTAGACRRPRSDAGNVSGSPSARDRDRLDRPVANAGQRGEAVRCSFPVAAGTEVDRAVSEPMDERRDTPSACSGTASVAGSIEVSVSGDGNTCVSPPRVSEIGVPCRRTSRLPCGCARGRGRNLLTKHGADRESASSTVRGTRPARRPCARMGRDAGRRRARRSPPRDRRRGRADDANAPSAREIARSSSKSWHGDVIRSGRQRDDAVAVRESQRAAVRAVAVTPRTPARRSRRDARSSCRARTAVGAGGAA